MSDLMKTGLDWLGDQMKSHVSQSVTYSRGGDSVVVDATIGRTEFEVLDSVGMMRREIRRDFLIQAADLDFGSGVILPESGDIVTDAGRDYEVCPTGPEPAWRWSDAYRKVLRIHTKEYNP